MREKDGALERFRVREERGGREEGKREKKRRRRWQPPLD